MDGEGRPRADRGGLPRLAEVRDRRVQGGPESAHERGDEAGRVRDQRAEGLHRRRYAPRTVARRLGDPRGQRGGEGGRPVSDGVHEPVGALCSLWVEWIEKEK